MSIQLSLTIDLPAHDVAAEFMIKLSEAFALLKGLAMPTPKEATAPRAVESVSAPVIEPEAPKPVEPRKTRAPKVKAEDAPPPPAKPAEAPSRETLVDELRAMGNALMNKMGADVVRAELARFGAARYPELSDDNAAKLHATFRTLMASA